MKEKNRTWHFPSPISFPILKESFQSNWLMALIAGLGNAILCIVVVLILSTLDLNSTQASLRLVFSNSDMLSLLGQSSIAMDLSYKGSVYLYRYPYTLLCENGEEIGTFLNGTYAFSERLDTDETLSSTLDNLLFDPYVENYESLGHEQAKEETLSSLSNTLDALSSLFPFLEERKDILLSFLGSELDSYRELSDSMETTPEHSLVFRHGISLFLSDFLMTKLSLPENLARSLGNSYEDSVFLYSEQGLTGFEMLFAFLENTISSSFDEDFSSPILSFLQAIQEARDNNVTAFDNNTKMEGEEIGYREEVFLEQIQALLSDVLETQGALFFLPDFQVDYLTDELGRPYYVNEEGERVFPGEYRPDLILPVSPGMERKSTLLEKKHRLELTGTDYSAEEIETAKEEAETQGKLLLDRLDSFLKEYFLLLEEGQDPYYEENSDPLLPGTLLSGNIEEKCLSDLRLLAGEQLLLLFDVEAISDISKDVQGVSGEELLDLVEKEALGAIHTFENDFAPFRYDTLEDSFLVSLVQAGSTLLDLLPVHVEESIVELGNMNLYGILVGLVFFGLAGLLLPIVYSILVSNELICGKVESGSMAFLLSAPIKRSKVIFTQMVFLILSETFLSLLLLLGALVSRSIGIALGGSDFELSLPLDMLLKFVLGNYLAMLSISGICFLSSALFSTSRMAIGIGGGISIFFLVTAILGLFGGPAMPSTIRIESMNVFNYLSILSFFDAQAAIQGTSLYWYKLIGLLALFLLTYGLSFPVFAKKDLPI